MTDKPIIITRTSFEPELNKQGQPTRWHVAFTIEHDDNVYYNPTTVTRSQLYNPDSYTEQEIMGIAIRNALPATLVGFFADKTEHTPQFSDEEVENWGIGVLPPPPPPESEEDDGKDSSSNK